ncbi:MAG: BON domain-containing protein [Planctomycetaceae bacterium]|nr:BON domain-containing protein [Planctomycetales bacterium]MCB9941001.1 BON domain-containing protein [Planctomycetaceae bacterium]
MRRFFVTLALIAIALAPFGARANDRQIAEQIVRSLKQRKAAGELQGFNIDLQVDKGAVWLKGYVSEPEQERIALDIARRVEGVEKVFNQIELRSPESAEAEAVATSSRRTVNEAQPLATTATEAVQPEQSTTQLASSEQEVNDSQEESRRIAQALVSKLRDEQKAGNLEKFGIDIQVDKGTLWLKGQLASEDQQHRVLEIARRIPGVKQVVNELSIKNELREPKEVVQEAVVTTPKEITLAPATSRRQTEVEPIATIEPKAIVESVSAESDSQSITDEVLGRLAKQKELGALRDFGIDVQVDKGVVWMSGYVADEEQRTLALDMARYVSGVKQVVNDLSVTKPLEETTAQFVAHPVHRDPSVPVEPQGLQPLRPSLAPQAAPAQQAQAAPALPNGMSYLPTSQQSQVAGWALVNVGGNQPQAQAQYAPQMQQMYQPVSNQLQMPMAFAPARPVNYTQMQGGGQPQPMMGGHGVGVAPARYDHPQLPGYAWPSYAAHPNYGAVTYPQQYSAQAWPYIGPFYPYPQVPLGWRKVTLEWDDGWWQLDFKDRH